MRNITLINLKQLNINQILIHNQDKELDHYSKPEGWGQRLKYGNAVFRLTLV